MAPLAIVNTAVSAPIPTASAVTAISVNPGFFAMARKAKRKSCQQLSKAVNVHISRQASFSTVGLPNRRRDSARSPVSADFISRWKHISSSRSRSSRRRCHSARSLRRKRRMSGGLHYTRNRCGQSLPIVRFRDQGFAPTRRQAIVFRPPIVFRWPPFGINQAVQLQAVQGGVERAFLDAQHLLRDLLNRLGDPVPVHGPARERFQDEHVERTLHELARAWF